MIDFKPPVALDSGVKNLFGMLIYAYVNSASSQIFALLLNTKDGLKLRIPG